MTLFFSMTHIVQQPSMKHAEERRRLGGRKGKGKKRKTSTARDRPCPHHHLFLLVVVVLLKKPTHGEGGNRTEKGEKRVETAARQLTARAPVPPSLSNASSRPGPLRAFQGATGRRKREKGASREKKREGGGGKGREEDAGVGQARARSLSLSSTFFLLQQLLARRTRGRGRKKKKRRGAGASTTFLPRRGVQARHTRERGEGEERGGAAFSLLLFHSILASLRKEEGFQ